MQTSATSPSTASSVASSPQKWDQDSFPIYHELITTVRTLDAMNPTDLAHLKIYLALIASHQTGRDVHLTEQSLTPELQTYLQILLKLHQVLALVDVSFDQLSKDKKAHGKDIQNFLKMNGGLDYTPRERTPQGRLLEHAADSKPLLAHLLTAEVAILDVQPKLSDSLCRFSFNEEDKSAALFLKRDYIMLTLSANGKAELYFHAYVWTVYATMLATEYPDLVACDEIKRLSGLSNKPKQVLDMTKKYPFGETEYNQYVADFASLKSNKRQKLIQTLQVSLLVAQLSDNSDSLHWLEKLLIQLLGYPDINTRDNAVVFLNSLYDGNDWQQQEAFRPVIRCIGQHFKVNLSVRVSLKSQIFLGLSAPSPLSSVHDTVLTWHKIEDHNIIRSSEQETEIEINFGKFWKCGFYDWRLMEMSVAGKLETVKLTKPPVIHSFPTSANKYSQYDDDDQYDADSIAQGRYIIQARGLRDETFHEVQIDNQDCKIDYTNQTYQKRGTFEDVEKALPAYGESGVSTLYLMGVFERDNCPLKGNAQESYYNKSHSMLKKENASAFAVTSRDTPCEMLGGKTKFESMMLQAKKENIKIIVDSMARISSSRHHRKFRDLLLHQLDEEGRRNICYGTDGQAIKYEDTVMLNYRKLEAWDLLVDEVLGFATRSGIDGIHLDNGQAWPQIFEPDLEELTRVDADGSPAYSAQDLMNGEIVIRNENYGYWHTNTMEQHANPFFVKLCRKLWAKFPNFMILGECWGGYKFELRHIMLARSGVIPRLFKLPQTICSLLGKKLHSDGQLTKTDKRETVVAMKKWYDDSHNFLPEGAILIQSSTAHSWPYPAYLYGKGAWAAVDILYFMPDIPITFNGEVDGEIYRLGQGSVHQAEQQEAKSGTGLKKSGSQLRLAMSEPTKVVAVESKGMPRINSGSNLAALVVEQPKTQQEMSKKEEEFKAEMGSKTVYDLSKIKSHYENRRYLRQSKMVLRYGEMCPLTARSMDQQKSWLPDVLAFARYSLMETAIISINLSDQEQTFYLDLESLSKLFKKTLTDNTVIVTSSLLPSKNQLTDTQDYYFLREFMTIKHSQTLIPFSSSIQIVTVCPDDKFTFQKALSKSIERTKHKLLNGKDIESEQISLLLMDCLKTREHDAAFFAKTVGGLMETFLEQMNVGLYDLVHQNSQLTSDPKLFASLVALCENVAQTKIKPASECRKLVESNKLGPIVFCSPELGRWSTVGGLGVMVDELSIGLANLGQEVVVISPYYDRNRKGATGYLATDPAGIDYVDNIHVQLDTLYTLGVHEGTVNGVRVVFLHQSEVFPIPYPDADAQMTTRQIALFSKACLEWCCQRKKIPSVCVTNDWFTGFVAGYAKVGIFGQSFRNTTFLHICHNLMEDYEGRIYPNPQDDYLQFIHQLPRDWLVDPNWQKIMINPSRIAIMMSDQWSTVSLSYRDDLMNSSPLAPLLRQKPLPFAHPNGIPIAERVKKLDSVAPNHLHAKTLIQKKYFNLSDLDDSIPLFAFVGRITTQKGVHLILDIAEDIIMKYEGKVQFLVGGPANMRDPYSAQCATRMWHLKAKYPNSFWAAPEEFFMDGAVVNRGADFGLMPSLFEPGGIVQHEFFVGSTPVVAFKTGGLKDSVIEFQFNSEVGCGFTFESYTKGDFIFAMQRAIGIFNNKHKYEKLRVNAFNATMPGETVSKAWLTEFYRLKQKVYYEHEEMLKKQAKIESLKEEEYEPLNIFGQMFGDEFCKLNQLDDIHFGAAEDTSSTKKARAVVSEFDKLQSHRIAKTFMLHNRGPQHKRVQVCGSFDNWDKRHQMTFDPVTSQWFISLQLPKGDHFYKYVIDETNWVVNAEERQCRDNKGNLNNFITL